MHDIFSVKSMGSGITAYLLAVTVALREYNWNATCILFMYYFNIVMYFYNFNKFMYFLHVYSYIRIYEYIATCNFIASYYYKNIL